MPLERRHSPYFAMLQNELQLPSPPKPYAADHGKSIPRLVASAHFPCDSDSEGISRTDYSRIERVPVHRGFLLGIPHREGESIVAGERLPRKKVKPGEGCTGIV